ncbi:cytochrome b [Zymomonas mobilis]|uniref:Cytochrome b n=1 Tax=Zymomonas mobilis subsp. pomaceae (strain ATCC 29192 / DSM 22645 / JCM 10191 / CCUG 17912 / NBRC 13757 / NCIMB 11200 / NRRL B-4491 / Barker I) TaxID=579138 RepID=F8EUK3_ZYMMT|nr:cytochrome b N-terminal domain-containing protein [Zymomonas mobilis]AEI37219.1 Cytochrome b/b6 domain protein [Zymomonas mobilis subsp. pomaceae ATCC 29192]MDX5948589.1 cytochrome b N-terminal domain-containing protein [Zymomonas mobilis subsp. pomaceae]GEB88395.1 cytochrome b [Zymomonas mobilis subsp. pomaceae]
MTIPPHKYQPKYRFTKWLDDRLPLIRLFHDVMGGGYLVPRNLSWLWNFGALAGIALTLQIVTGLALAMHYIASSSEAFNSIEAIMRYVNLGWLIRYGHMVGASLFFAALYIHMLRGIYYGSYKAPREMIWLIGVVLFMLSMATAFLGYTLAWGQMSYWASQVITGLFSVVPFFGEHIRIWVLGGFTPNTATVNRFFVLHFTLPFVILGVVGLHIWALHRKGSGNPTGIEVTKAEDVVPMHPYYIAKDAVAVGVFLLIFCSLLFFCPNIVSDPDNYVPANNLVTPPHIKPEWYFWPFYAILRSFTVDFLWVPAKMWGVIGMGLSVFCWFLLPWLDNAPVRSGRYRPLFRLFFLFFLLDMAILGFCGRQPAEEPWIRLGQFASLYYFAFFFVILPVLPVFEKTLPVPKSLEEAGYPKTTVPLNQPPKKGEGA